MKQYIGVKLINAKPMTRAEYNAFRGWTVPADENPADDGYLVEYLDGGKGNTDLYQGYVSWSPSEVFNNAYGPTDGMTFGLAVEAMKRGAKVARGGWNGKGMWLALIEGNRWGIGGHAPYDLPGGAHIQHASFIGMRTADEKFVPWLASQTDILASDWTIVE